MLPDKLLCGRAPLSLHASHHEHINTVTRYTILSFTRRLCGPETPRVRGHNPLSR
jgi:hypothetical protein